MFQLYMAYGVSVYVYDVFASCGSHVLAGAACCERAAGAVRWRQRENADISITAVACCCIEAAGNAVDVFDDIVRSSLCRHE